MRILGEVWALIRRRRNFWLVPLLVLLVLAGVLLVLGDEPVPTAFRYSVF